VYQPCGTFYVDKNTNNISCEGHNPLQRLYKERILPPVTPQFWLDVVLQSLTLFFLLVGLLGLVIPVFPGLTVMWIATLVYAGLQQIAKAMTVWDWILFSLITILMIVGNVIDNIIIARHVREKEVPWSSIILGFLAGLIASLFFTPVIGIVAAPAGLFLAELYRLKDRKTAFESTRAWMTGWGWSFAARFVIGMFMVIFWMLWAWI
jgi:hypothetical protein